MVKTLHHCHQQDIIQNLLYHFANLPIESSSILILRLISHIIHLITGFKIKQIIVKSMYELITDNTF